MRSAGGVTSSVASETSDRLLDERLPQLSGAIRTLTDIRRCRETRLRKKEFPAYCGVRCAEKPDCYRGTTRCLQIERRRVQCAMLLGIRDIRRNVEGPDVETDAYPAIPEIMKDLRRGAQIDACSSMLLGGRGNAARRDARKGPASDRAFEWRNGAEMSNPSFEKCLNNAVHGAGAGGLKTPARMDSAVNHDV